MNSGRIYVGNLPMHVQRRDLDDLFSKYGKINFIELKSYGDSAPFAFIQYEDPRDAHDAVCGRNGFSFGDVKLRVEYPRGEGFPKRGRGGPKTRRSDFRVIVTGLPPTGSWQDLKDHMREAGDICYTDVQPSGDGLVEFVRREDMEYAVHRLDRTEFRSHQGETSFIRIFEDRMTPSWDRSRSRSRSRGRYSPQYYGRGSPPPRYPSQDRYDMPRYDPPPRRYQPQYSPPPRHYR